MEIIFFVLFAAVAVLAALSVILQKNPVYSALSLIVVIASLAGLFLLLKATFLAVLQIVIYAGAIMALFLFVIMMIDPKQEAGPLWRLESKTACVVLLLMAGATIWILIGATGEFDPITADLSVKALARELFTTYVLPFEAISALIISSVIGALYIARKEDS